MEFELNKPQWYEVQFVTLTADKDGTEWDADQYGNRWHSVKFTNDAGTHLWLAKETPEEGKSYYGHFEKTKSGKALRFKRDKEPEESKPANAHAPKSDTQYLKDLSDMPLRVYTATIGYVDAVALMKDDNYRNQFLTYIQDVSGELLAMSDNIRGDGQKAATHEPEQPQLIEGGKP